MNPTRIPRLAELDRLIATEEEQALTKRKPQTIEVSPRKQRIEEHARKMRERAAEAAQRKCSAVTTFGVPYAVAKLIRAASDKFLVPYELIRYPHQGQSFANVAKARLYVAQKLRKKGLSLPLIGFYLGMTSGGVFHRLYGRSKKDRARK